MWVVVLGLKGGRGKSTLAIHLAVAAHLSGLSIILADSDFQATALAWAKARDQLQPRVLPVRAYQLRGFIDGAKGDGTNMVIVDTAPRIDADAPALAALADLIVIPVRPTMPDLVASQSAFRMAQSSNRPFSIVISQANTRSIEAADARAGLSEHYDVAPMMLCQRTAYARALASGRAVSEFEPHGKAAEEINELWNYLRARLQRNRNQDYPNTPSPSRPPPHHPNEPAASVKS
jgi:chromosome partitioning protein